MKLKFLTKVSIRLFQCSGKIFAIKIYWCIMEQNLKQSTNSLFFPTTKGSIKSNIKCYTQTEYYISFVLKIILKYSYNIIDKEQFNLRADEKMSMCQIWLMLPNPDFATNCILIFYQIFSHIDNIFPHHFPSTKIVFKDGTYF